MDKASDEGCDRAVRSYNERLPAGDTRFADRFTMVAGEGTHIVEKEDEEKSTIIKTPDSSLTSREDLAAAEMSL